MKTLYEKFNLFNEKEGKLRVVVIHKCQLKCKFCHKEGILSHSTQLSHEDFASLINSFYELGGKR
jgi:molybdenum cofactor biosynthesis enzyme MoaA